MFRHVLRLLTITMVVAFILAACAPAATPTTAPVQTEAPAEPTQAEAEKPAEPTQAPASLPEQNVQLPEVDPFAVSGDVIMAGSSTVFPLAERMAERFKDEGFAGNITIDSIGSGAGFERFCVNGESGIANASRAIKDSEVDPARQLAVTRSSSASVRMPWLLLSAQKMIS